MRGEAFVGGNYETINNPDTLHYTKTPLHSCRSDRGVLARVGFDSALISIYTPNSFLSLGVRARKEGYSLIGLFIT